MPFDLDPFVKGHPKPIGFHVLASDSTAPQKENSTI